MRYSPFSILPLLLIANLLSGCQQKPGQSNLNEETQRARGVEIVAEFQKRDSPPSRHVQLRMSIESPDQPRKDYEFEINEKDTTHFDEIAASFAPGIYPGIHSKEELVQRLKDNYTTRFAHHHVFHFDLMEKMLNYFDFKVLHQQQIAPFHLTMIAQKALS